MHMTSTFKTPKWVMKKIEGIGSNFWIGANKHSILNFSNLAVGGGYAYKLKEKQS